MDYLGERKNGLRPLEEFAFQLLKKCKKEKTKIIVSDAITKELEKYIPKEKIKERLSEFSDLIIEVKHSTEQLSEAKDFWEKNNRKFPELDILHAIIARDENAVLVSRDKHFSEIGITENFFPEELL